MKVSGKYNSSRMLRYLKYYAQATGFKKAKIRKQAICCRYSKTQTIF